MDKPLITAHESDIPAGAYKKDAVPGALRELFFLDNPSVAKTDTAVDAQSSTEVGTVWVYYPWLNVAIRIPDEETYFRLRTARNRNVIRDAEQQAFRASHIGVAGLSVGSAALHSIVASGGAKRLRLADPDIIEITNLNRISASLPATGENKALIAALTVWEMDPFADIDVWKSGVAPSTVDAFAQDLTVCVEEMDSIDLKISLREACRRKRVPVVMATDNGNGAIVDVERFDLEPDRPLFHGRVELTGKKTADLSRDEFNKLASEIIDPTFFTDRQRESIAQIGATLSGVAQISTAASIAGASAAYAVRAIACGAHMPSGRYTLGCEEAFAANRV